MTKGPIPKASAKALPTDNAAVRVSVCIPTYNGGGRIAPTLAAIESGLARLQGIESEVLVIGNGCTDDTEAVVAAFWKNCSSIAERKYVEEPRDGAAWARLRGFRESKGEILIFCDDDVIPEPRSFTVIFENATEEPDLGGGAGQILPTLPAGLSWPPWMDKRLKSNLAISESTQEIYNPPEVFQPVSAFVWFRRLSLAAWARRVEHQRFVLGPSSQGMWRADDLEMDIWVLKEGWRLKRDPRIVAFHKIAASRLSTEYFAQLMYWNGRSAQRIHNRFSHFAWLWSIGYCGYKLIRLDSSFLRYLRSFPRPPEAPRPSLCSSEINQLMHLFFQQGRVHEIISKALKPFRS